MTYLRTLRAVCLVAAVVVLAEVAILAWPAPSPAATPVTTNHSDVEAVAPLVAPAAEGPGTPADPVPTTTTVRLPQPIPADDAEHAPLGGLHALYRIRIPRIDLDQQVFEGVDLDTLSNGPGHWPGSAQPGDLGNVVIAGHRITWTHPFYYLDEVQPGDEIFLGDARYTVDKVFTVLPDDVWIIDPSPARTLTLFACHPRGSAAQRIVAKATYAGPAGA